VRVQQTPLAGLVAQHDCLWAAGIAPKHERAAEAQMHNAALSSMRLSASDISLRISDEQE
jgi:hypothetical protein